jgi:enoyl-CoA hydratase/carnithine racemase
VIARATWRALPALVAQAEAAPSVLVLLVDSADPACFCAGSDPVELAALRGNRGLARAAADEVAAGLAALANCAKPSIALLRGTCADAGLALALACDLRFASDSARIGMTHARLGLLPSFAELRCLANRVGGARAADMLFSARMLTAADAERIGLVDDYWRDDMFAEAVGEYVASVCGLSQYAVRGAKAMLRAVLAGAATETPQVRALFEQAFAGEDFREACVAMQEARGPSFTWR